MEAFLHPYESEIEIVLTEQTLNQFGIEEKDLLPYLYRRFWIVNMESSKLPTFPLEEFPRRWMRFWLKSLGLSPEEISYQSHFIPTEMTFGSPLKNIFENLQERHHRLYNHWGQQNNTIDGVKQSKSDVKEWLKMSKAKRSKHKRSVAYKHILKHDLLTHLNDTYQASPNEPSKIDGFSYPDEWLAWSEESLVERELNAHHFGLHKGFEMTEEQLEDYLSNHLEEIHPNLKLMKRQFILPKGRIDLLAKDLKTNRIWVIELKVEKDTDVIWQKWYYVNEIKKRFPNHDITFVLIAPEVDEEIIEPLTLDDTPTDIYTFQTKMRQSAIETLTLQKVQEL